MSGWCCNSDVRNIAQTTYAWWCQSSHSTLILPSDLNAESIKGATLPLMQNQIGKDGDFVIASTSDYSFAINGAEMGVGYAWSRASLLLSLLVCKMQLCCLDQQGRCRGYLVKVSKCLGHRKQRINFQVLSQRGGCRYFSGYIKQQKLS